MTDIRWIRRPRRQLLTAGLAIVVVAIATAATTNPPAAWEISVFRAVNELPRQAEWLLWPLQQAGMALAVPIGAVVMWFVVRHLRPPTVLIVGGIVFGWGGAKVIKEWVNRGRPGSLIPDVVFGFDVPVDGFGFPSGHAVVALTLAVAFAPYATRGVRLSMYLAAGAVAFSRVYMGAHMPIDVIGGAALGVMIGSIVTLVAGVRSDRVLPNVPGSCP